MTKRLRKKFILINMLLVGSVLLVVFAAMCVSNYQRLVMDSMKVMERYFDDGGKRPIPKLDFEGKRDWRDFPLSLSFCAVVDSDGKLVSYQSDNLTVSEETVAKAVDAAEQKIEESGQKNGILHGLGLRYLEKEYQGQRKIAFVDRTQEYTSMKSFLFSSLLVGTGALVALFIISFFLSAWVVHPVEKAWTQQKQFVADASHELKTPLTVILANTGILLSHPQDSIEQQKRWIENTQEEAVNMKKLVDDMLFLARSDASVALVYSQVNFSDIVWSAVLAFESVAFEQGFSMDSDIAEDISFQGDEGKLRELVRILLDNACKYCASKGKIFVQLKREGEKERFTFSVRNTVSEKLSEQELERMFERFFRADKARNREKGGYGLGLAIAKSIADQHHARIGASYPSENEIAVTVQFRIKEQKK